MKKGFILSLLVIFFISSVCAADIPSYQDKYVNDFASVLSISEQQDLESLFYFIDQNTTAEMVFVSVESCSPYAPQEYALKIFDSWKIGKADKDNGLLILFCKNETKIYAMTGYGLEGILPDSKLGRFLDQYYVPERNAGNISYGIVSFSKEVASVIFENGEEVYSGQTSSKNSQWIDVLIIFIVMIIILLILSRSKKIGFLPIFFPISSPSHGGFGGGGFSGGFGGGMSGGGGAGR